MTRRSARPIHASESGRITPWYVVCGDHGLARNLFPGRDTMLENSALLPLTLLLAPVCAAQTDTVLRTYDVRSLTEAPLGRGGDRERSSLLALPLLLPLPSGDSLEEMDQGMVLAAQLPTPGIGAGDLTHLLAAVAGRALDDQDQWIQLQAGILQVRAEPSVQASVAELLTALQHYCSRRARLSLYTLSADDVRELSTVLSPGEVRGLLADRRPTAVLATSALLGSAHSWENGALLSYVRDYDVEVSKKARVSDPKLDLVYDGDRASFAVFETIEGRLHVIWGTRTTAVQQPIPVRRISSFPPGRLQLPRVDVSTSIGSAVVEDGGGVVLGSEPGSLRLLVLEREESGPASGAGFEIVPVGSIVTAPLRHGMPGLRLKAPGEMRGQREPTPNADVWRRAMYDRVCAAFEKAGGTVASGFRDALVVRGTAAERQTAREAIGALAVTAPTISIECRMGAVDREVAQALVRDGTAPEQVAATLGTRAFATTRPGNRFVMLHGTEGAFIRDYDVEIAQAATAANPIVDSWFDGFVLQGVAHCQLDGGLSVSVELEHDRIETGEPFALEATDLGSVDEPRMRHRRAEQTLVFPPRDAHWRVLHVDTAGDRSAVAIVRATAGG